MSDHGTALRAVMPRPPVHLPESAVQDQSERLASWLAAWRSFLAANEAILARSGVTLRELAALLEVDRSTELEGPTVGMLADCLRIRHNTSVGLVTGMCNKGYMRRMRDAQDRRLTHVQLTDRGHEVLDELVRAHGRAFHEADMERVPVAAA